MEANRPTPFRPNISGRAGFSTSTPAIIPRQLSFHEELLEKCRERGLAADTPANFGCRRVENPRVRSPFDPYCTELIVGYFCTCCIYQVILFCLF